MCDKLDRARPVERDEKSAYSERVFEANVETHLVVPLRGPKASPNRLFDVVDAVRFEHEVALPSARPR